MGLYLCVFDQCGDDICGVEVGLYKYFAEFRQKVALYVDQKLLTGTMPTLLQHLDCDGSWSVSEFGITPKNLFECFADTDCEFLIDRLLELCNCAIKENRPIMFQ